VISGGRTPDDHAIGRDDRTIARERRVIERDDHAIGRDDPLIDPSARSRLASTLRGPARLPLSPVRIRTAPLGMEGQGLGP
jgi:hypothetical protein